MDAECHACQAAAAAGQERPPPSGDRWLRPVDPNRLLPGTRWGGVRKASTVWRQVATAGGPESSAARHPLGCHDGDRLEAYPTMATGWKPILRWRQAGRLSCDGDRLEAYPTVVVSRYLDCKIWELTEDLSLALDVIPQDEAIEIVAAGEEHPPLGLLGHAVRKTDVFLGL